MTDETVTPEAELRPLSEGERALADIVAVVEQVHRHLEHRDISNAALHMQATQERPLTLAVEQLLHQTIRKVWDELRQLRSAAAPVPADRTLLMLHLSPEHMQQLAAMEKCSGGTGDGPAMAQAVLENYVATLSSQYCFEHKTDGCGDPRGNHTGAPASA